MEEKVKEKEISLMELNKLSFLDFIVTDEIQKQLDYYRGKMMISRDHSLFKIKGFTGEYKRKKIKTGLFSKPKWEKVVVLEEIIVEYPNDTYDAIIPGYINNVSFAFILEKFQNWHNEYCLLNKKFELFKLKQDA